MKYATYIRVSTAKQGRSGLGLDAQRKMCEDFIRARGGEQAQEFVDIESGTHRNRKGLQAAIAYCKANNCALVIAKLDRLARDVEFCFKVVNTGIEIHFTDMPQMNTLLLGVFAAVAQYERELTSDRTKKALAVKKSQGAKLGAASDKYAMAMARKTEEEKKKEAAHRGNIKASRFRESRDVQVILKVLRNVFPRATYDEDPAKWRWVQINTKEENRERMRNLMCDYKSIDESRTLFAKWDLDDEKAFAIKLKSKIQTIQKSFKNK